MVGGDTLLLTGASSYNPFSMSDFNYMERRHLEEYLKMGDGYVLDFSNRTFQEFVSDAVKLNIDDESVGGFGSKANRLRHLMKHQPDYIVGKLIAAFVEYREGTYKEPCPELADKCRAIAQRLLKPAPVPDAIVLSVLSKPEQPIHTKPVSTIATPKSSSLLDVFVSHSTEDKDYVEPLVKALEAAGIRVWFDRSELEWGDDLRSAIDRGLLNCRYGIVVFSKAFLRKKKWTEYELNSLFALEQPNRKIILPIWHGITRDDLLQYSPAFADRLAKISSTDSHGEIVESLLDMLGRLKSRESEAANTTVSVATKRVQTEAKTDAYSVETTGGKPTGADAYSEDLERQARQVVGYQMTFNGQQLLRQLLIHGTFRSSQQFIPEISIDTQNEQMKIAKEAGIVKQQPGTPAVAGGYYTINPRFLEALKKVVYEELAKHR